MKRLVSGLAVSTVLLSPAAKAPEVPPVHATLPDATISVAEARFVREVFTDNERYWSNRHIGKVALTKLIILSGKQTFKCHESDATTNVLGSLSLAEYCVTDNAVVETALDVNTQIIYGKGALGNAFVISHEFGHAVERAKGSLQHTSESFNGRVQLELQASFYAGEYMARAYTAHELEAVAEMLRTTPADGYHGTSVQQADAFMSGVRAEQLR